MAGGPRGRIAILLTLGVLLLHAPAADARRAYVVNAAGNSVSMFETNTGTAVGAPIPVHEAAGIAMTPDGRLALVISPLDQAVSVIDTASGQVAGAPIPVGLRPSDIAVSPDGTTAYVVGVDEYDVARIAAIDIATHRATELPIQAHHHIGSIAVSPDGHWGFIGDSVLGEGLRMNLNGPQALRALETGGELRTPAVTPDGRLVLFTDAASKTLWAFDSETLAPIAPPAHVPGVARAIAVSPDGHTAYVATQSPPSLTAVEIPGMRVENVLQVGGVPGGVTFSPDGQRAYVTVSDASQVRAFDTATFQQVGEPIPVGAGPQDVVVTPDLSPQAVFAAGTGSLLRPVAFDGSASSDPDGSVVRYDWSFGDGSSAAGSGPTARHQYSTSGTHRATLAVTDAEGCSASVVYTGQTAYCSGLPAASRNVFIPPNTYVPAVRVGCPRSVPGRVCRFKLHVVSGRRKTALTLSKPAGGKVKRGRSKLIYLVPKPRYANGVGGRRKLLIRGARFSGGSARTFVRWFDVVDHRVVAP